MHCRVLEVAGVFANGLETVRAGSVAAEEAVGIATALVQLSSPERVEKAVS
jgi:hypothetical protein